jgi:hypothetical protein
VATVLCTSSSLETQMEAGEKKTHEAKHVTFVSCFFSDL